MTVHQASKSEAAAVAEAFLRERDLARRWRTSPRSLQRWRADGTGPAFVRLNGSIRYRLNDVVAYEDAARTGGTTPS